MKTLQSLHFHENQGWRLGKTPKSENRGLRGSLENQIFLLKQYPHAGVGNKRGAVGRKMITAVKVWNSGIRTDKPSRSGDMSVGL